jgi:hypothetical protein
VSEPGPDRLRTFAFGDLDTGVWGVAAESRGTALASFATSVTARDGDEESFLAADGLELRFAPLGPAAALAPATAGLRGFVQLCVVDGAIHRDGSEHDVSCLGMRGAVSLPLPPTGSARAVSAWFGPEYAVAVATLRPERSRGHDGDVVAGAILDEGAALAVDEPRLSTTYDGDGTPARAALEVWLEDLQVEEEEEPRPQYPRRLAGEATGERAKLSAAGFTLDAQLFQWHARGVDGAGVYLLATRA